MSSEKLNGTYDKYYYMTSCGVEYERNEHWISFFGNIADQIVKEINPKTVLDAGCGKGFLVEALRDRGVEAYGIDISEYAIEEVREDIKPYCKVGSILEPFDKNYDLIITMEVIEHLNSYDGRKAIENICKHTDDVIFTSTPFDYREETHINVQPIEYWVELFAYNKFNHKLDYDLSYITDHAMRFTSLKIEKIELIKMYEREYFRKYQENRELRKTVLESKERLAYHFKEIETFAIENATIKAEIESIIDEKDELEKEIENITDEKKELEKEMKSITDEKDELEKEMESITDEKKELEKEIENITDEKKELEKEMKSITDEKDELEKEIESITDEKNELEKEIEDLICEKNIIEKDNKNMNIEKDSLKKENEILNRHINEMSDGIKQLNHLLEEKDKYVKHLETYINVMKSTKGWRALEKVRKLRNKFPRTNKIDEIKTERTQVQQEISIYSEIEKEYIGKCGAEVESFDYKPLVSIVTPIYNTPIRVLKEMIQSVKNQVYPNWEICIVNASPENQEISNVLKKYSSEDKRIRFIELEKNLGIAGNTDEGIRIAKGEFIGLLDHDDLLSPNAIYEVVKSLQNQNDKYDFFYSDKDMVDEDTTRRFNPLYKPDWSPDIMYSANYLTHFCVVRKSIMDQVGLFDSETDGAQDWDIFLRITEKTSKIYHIPHILYHWRILKTSVASGIDAKPYALNAQLKSIENHCTRIGEECNVSFKNRDLSLIKVDWNQSKSKDIAVIIYDNQENANLDMCIKSIKKTKDMKVIVLTSYDEKAKMIENNEIQIHNKEFNGYWDAYNYGASISNAEFFVFMTSDTIIETDEAIIELADWSSKKNVALASPKIIKSNGEINNIGLILNNDDILGLFSDSPNPHYNEFGYSDWYRNFNAFSNNCIAIESKKFFQLGGFNEALEALSIVELSLNAKSNNYRNTYTPYAIVKSDRNFVEEVNKNKSLYKEIRSKYIGSELDEYWNKNLSSKVAIENEKKNSEELNKNVSESPKKEEKKEIGLWDKYSSDATVLSEWFDFSIEDIEKNKKIVNTLNADDVKTVNWFLPAFDYAFYAGVYTILRYANHMCVKKGVKNNFVIVGDVNKQQVKNAILEAFPGLKDSKVYSISKYSQLKRLPSSDAAISTLWTTAYFLLKFNNTKKKFYFIQDYEPYFYPAGATFAQAEETYKFGFYGITNTIGLKELYEKEYSGIAEDIVPCVDTNIFYRVEEKEKKDTYKVFFYGRPGHPRNGFELGAAGLKILKQKLGDKVDIVTAGSDWDPKDYGLEGVIRNLGRLKYEETGDLYRSCDVGLVMMFTKHPSYLPFELMSCGCTVVSNYNPSTTWLLKDKENCILTQASASCIAENIQNILDDEILRNKIIQNASKEILENHTNWDEKLDKIYNFMSKPI